MKLMVMLRPDHEDGGFVALCPAIPGCISEGDTVEEALVNIRDAIAECLESIAAHGGDFPADEAGVIVTSVDAGAPSLAEA